MIGFTQVVILVLVGFLLFGNLPKRVEEMAKAAKILKRELKEEAKGGLGGPAGPSESPEKEKEKDGRSL